MRNASELANTFPSFPSPLLPPHRNPKTFRQEIHPHPTRKIKRLDSRRPNVKKRLLTSLGGSGMHEKPGLLTSGCLQIEATEEFNEHQILPPSHPLLVFGKGGSFTRERYPIRGWCLKKAHGTVGHSKHGHDTPTIIQQPHLLRIMPRVREIPPYRYQQKPNNRILLLPFINGSQAQKVRLLDF